MNFPDSLLAVRNVAMLCVYSAEILLSVSLFKDTYWMCFFPEHSKKGSRMSLPQLKTKPEISDCAICSKFTQEVHKYKLNYFAHNYYI